MKRLLIVGTLLLVVFVVVFRQRIFVRDPLGKVERNGVAQDGTRLYINYSNDVLVENLAQHQFVLVQGWNALPGVPQHLFCLTGMVCWTDADRAAVFPVEGAGGRTQAVMSAKDVMFVDESGAKVRAALR
ncbi:MAG TPA: hypothetical protein VNX17_12240 [Edaphobacter sp.]|nr:hypothetical protein [Edaphobacter sp.]